VNALPETLDPRTVRAVAMDLDRTIVGDSLQLTPRLVAAVKGAAQNGIIPIVATGRMFRSSRPFAAELGVTAPLICYQGALIADPVTGEWLQHHPMPVGTAREVIEAIRARGEHVNVYVDDELYVDELNVYALEYARHAKLEAHPVGDVAEWLTEPTTKLVVVGEPERLDVLEAELKATYDGRLFIAKSLPYFLEVAEPGVSKGSALEWVARHLRIDTRDVVAFGDGANDVELLETAGLGVMIEMGDAALEPVAGWRVARPEDEGVSGFVEALTAERAAAHG
jgi:Cof subfamily protein (haloacid dehalogenase superfamily)